MTTFPLWLKHQQLAAQQAKAIAQAVSEADAVFERPTRATAAGDSRKLRGIPAIGRGVAGVIGDGPASALPRGARA